MHLLIISLRKKKTNNHYSAIIFSVFFDFVLHTDRHGRWCGCSAIACELGSEDTADHSMHAAPAWYITPGEKQLGLTLGQRDLYTLTLHFLHPVGLFSDLCPQSGKGSGGTTRN